MALVPAICTQCGAQIEVDDTHEAGICKHCGTAFITEKAINNYNITNNYNIQNAVINVQGVNLERLKRMGDEKIKSLHYPFEMDDYKKAQEYFSKVLECEENAEYQLKYDLCDKAIYEDRTAAYEIVNIIDSVIDFIRSDSVIHSNSQNRALVYVGLINIMSDAIEAITMYYYERYSNNSLNHSVYISMFTGIVEKKLECAEIMMNYSHLEEVREIIIHLCETCEGHLASCITTNGLTSEMCSEVKTLAKKTQSVGEKCDSSYQARNDILTCDVGGYRANNTSSPHSSGCYIATCVYGSYDCPQVWTLRRFRDYTLDESWYGRVFIKCYYAISPTLVKWFGNQKLFRIFWKNRLDAMVANLNQKGIENTQYHDKY